MVAFLLVGVVVGPSVLGWVSSESLRGAGATDLLYPHRDAADHAGKFLRKKLADVTRDRAAAG